jgi:hypothetical protein
MRISKPKIIQEKKQIIYQFDIKSNEGSKTLWYSLHESFGDLLSNLCDAPLVALLIPAMATGEGIYIDGMISNKLLYNISGSLQRLLQHIIPTLRQVKIHPEEVCSVQTNRASGVATGFSGGIDSYCVLADHYYSNIVEGFKVTHLLFNNVGASAGNEQWSRDQYKRLMNIAEIIGLPFVRIDSNLNCIYRDYDKEIRFQQTRSLFQQTHTLRNVSVALLLQKGIGRYMYASTYKYTDVFVGASYDTAYSDPIILPLLSTDTLDVFSVGSQYSRIEKTLRVAEIPDSYKLLDVCTDSRNLSSYINCSKCEKCLRTLATLDIAGYLERYSDSFDLNVYKSHRDAYFETLFVEQAPLSQEIVQFAEERNYKFPISSHIIRSLNTLSGKTSASLYLKAKRVLLRKLRKLKHLFN